MPQFEYQCNACAYRFEKMVQRWDAKVKCPLCEGEVKKLMSYFSVGTGKTVTTELPAELRPKMCTNC